MMKINSDIISIKLLKKKRQLPYKIQNELSLICHRIDTKIFDLHSEVQNQITNIIYALAKNIPNRNAFGLEFHKFQFQRLIQLLSWFTAYSPLSNCMVVFILLSSIRVVAAA